MNLHAVTNRIVIAGALIVLGVGITGWLASYRVPRTAAVGSKRSFLILLIQSAVPGTQFISQSQYGPLTPERGAPCTSGIGTPLG